MQQVIMHGGFPAIPRAELSELRAQRMRAESTERDPAQPQNASDQQRAGRFHGRHALRNAPRNKFTLRLRTG